ncbi:MAG TPA: MerR family transcriptional regulator, partial [Polyangiaceae bacterium]|nr:MerR family transcriptional regulator [Polyangiaceae bacterium]
MGEARYRIGTVARLAGLTTHVIRVWERRYGAPAPVRSARGTRLYSELDVERLRLLKRAVDRGHAIGRVASLPSEELVRLTQAPAAVAANGDASE